MVVTPAERPELGAIIFDFDGTIADSEPLHLAAFQAVLADELDLILSEEEYAERYLAFDDRLLFTHLLRDRDVAVSPERLEQLLEQKEARYREIALSPRILPGAAEMIRATSACWPLAIASGALGHEVRSVLERVGLLDCFGVVVTAEMVSRGKPDPESFLAALERINESGEEPIPARSCLVVEDSVAGVRSGRAAGMRTLAVTTSYPAGKLAIADRVVASLEETVDPGALSAWFAALPAASPEGG